MIASHTGRLFPLFSQMLSHTRAATYFEIALPRQRDRVPPAVDLMAVQTAACQPAIRALERIRALPPDWDFAGSAGPNPISVERAIAVVPYLDQEAVIVAPWDPPHVSADEAGDVVLEWWHRARKLVLNVTAEQTTYLEIWGANIDTEMRDGASEDIRFRDLWAWLHS